MDKTKILSGYEIVDKGITKFDASLPETGLKDVVPNGSWLEQKQIQASIEARKHLIEVERIEKCISLSHADWREDLKLAEVTHKVGGYWQYLGHHVDKKLYLRPEEALFLIEVNCLLLKHNEVTVSLQKAYSLLLHDTLSVIQYKVYASLSRLGYKVFRHKALNKKEIAIIGLENAVIDKDTVVMEEENYKLDISSSEDKQIKQNKSSDSCVEIQENMMIMNRYTEKEEATSKKSGSTIPAEDVTAATNNFVDMEDLSNPIARTEAVEGVNKTNMGIFKNKNCKISESERIEKEIKMDTDLKYNIQEVHKTLLQNEGCEKMDWVKDTENKHFSKSGDNPIEKDTSNTNQNTVTLGGSKSREINTPNSGGQPIKDTNISSDPIDDSKEDNIIKDDKDKQPYFIAMLKKLRNRHFKPTNSEILHKHFENVPDLYQKHIVTVNVPEPDHIPKNIFVNKASYLLDLQSIRMKSVRPMSTESTNSSVTDEVNGNHVRRIRSTSGAETPQNPFPNPRFIRHFNYRPYNFWRPQHNNPNFYQFGMFFQRPCIPNMYFLPRFQYRQRANAFTRPNSPNVNFASNRRRKRGRTNLKTSQLRGIKTLAARLKLLIMSGNTQVQNIQSLQSLLHTYNMKYKTRLRLTENFDVINDETIVETIELDDDEELIHGKKPRLDKKGDTKFTENLNKLRQLALKLKDLEMKNKATARQRRVFSNAMKTFNKSYNADVYLNSNYEVIDRRHITLESSSESDCVVEEPQSNNKRKKLRNPFNVLKRLSEKLDTSNNPTTSKDDTLEIKSAPVQDIVYDEHLKKTFDKNWLPNENDFGRAEVVPIVKSSNIYRADSYKEEQLFEFMKDQPERYKTWLDAKISFLKYIKEATFAFKNQQLQYKVQEVFSSRLKPLISIDDCMNMYSVLEKLRIIQNNKDVNNETNLKIDFDVYSRDVQNFRKTNPPKPHFRVICIHESTTVPPAAEVSALYATCERNIPIVFGIVGIGSISYLQINPTELPVYIHSKDLL